MKQAFKDRKFVGDIDKDYAQKHKKVFKHNHAPNAADLYPIITEERMQAAYNLVKKIRNKA